MIQRLLLIGLTAWTLSAWSLKMTDGFTLSKIGAIFLEDSDEPVDETLLQQPFTYLGKGGQSYVFLSDDGSTVLKFLRGSKLSQIAFRTPFLGRENKERKILETEEKMRQTLRSYAIARDLFKQEAGILATHLSQTHKIATPIMLIDRSKIKHMIDPNSYPFIIQKRATLVKETIAQLMERGEVTAAKMALRSLFSLLQLRMQRGIEDGDPNLAKNFGFLDLEPIQIDGGSFQLGLTPSVSSIQSSQEDLQHWINKCYPELSDDFRSAYEDFLSQVL